MTSVGVRSQGGIPLGSIIRIFALSSAPLGSYDRVQESGNTRNAAMLLLNQFCVFVGFVCPSSPKVFGNQLELFYCCGDDCYYSISFQEVWHCNFKRGDAYYFRPHSFSGLCICLPHRVPLAIRFEKGFHGESIMRMDPIDFRLASQSEALESGRLGFCVCGSSRVDRAGLAPKLRLGCNQMIEGQPTLSFTSRQWIVFRCCLALFRASILFIGVHRDKQSAGIQFASLSARLMDADRVWKTRVPLKRTPVTLHDRCKRGQLGKSLGMSFLKGATQRSRLNWSADGEPQAGEHQQELPCLRLSPFALLGYWAVGLPGSDGKQKRMRKARFAKSGTGACKRSGSNPPPLLPSLGAAWQGQRMQAPFWTWGPTLKN